MIGLDGLVPPLWLLAAGAVVAGALEVWWLARLETTTEPIPFTLTDLPTVGVDASEVNDE